MCDPMDCSPPGPSVHGIHQARILEWVAMYSSRVSSRPRDRTRVSYISCTGRWVLYHERHLESPFIYYSASKYLVSSFFLKYTSLLLLFYLYYFPVINKYLKSHNSLSIFWSIILNTLSGNSWISINLSWLQEVYCIPLVGFCFSDSSWCLILL